MRRRRALGDPVHGQYGVSVETRRLQQFVVLGGDELATCRAGSEATARVGRLGGGHPVLVRAYAEPKVGIRECRTQGMRSRGWGAGCGPLASSAG